MKKVKQIHCEYDELLNYNVIIEFEGKYSNEEVEFSTLESLMTFINNSYESK